MSDERPMSLLRRAENWLEKRGKQPKRVRHDLDLGFRWICPEPGNEDTTHELPSAVFARLDNRHNRKYPWSFPDKAMAWDRALWAVAEALTLGEITD